MSSCFLVRQNGGAITMRRTAAIGDCIMATVVARKLAERGFPAIFQTHPGIAPLIQRSPWVSRVENPGGAVNVNLDGAGEAEKVNRRSHFQETFIASANSQLRHLGIDLGPALNCKPVLQVRANEQKAVAAQLGPYARPWVFICPRSNSYAVRQVPDGIWHEAARRMQGTKFWIGTHPAPPEIVDLRCRTQDMLAPLLSVADLLVTVDTGPMHVAVALGVPVVVILQSSSPEMHLSDQRDWAMIGPNLECLHCMERICPKNRWMPPCQNVAPDLIAAAVNERLGAYSDGKVSAVVPTYHAPGYRLNHVLENLLPQVDEIIVTREAGGAFPSDAMRHVKIYYYTKEKGGIGFGRNVNFGVRHTRHSWILIVNDDLYINAGTVQTMLAAAKPDTGILSPLVYFPDGKIYVSVKVRQPGARGWGHVDYKQGRNSFPNVTESEDACGCCLLMRREAFYRAGCFDEEYQFYAEDDQLSMDVRRVGYKILFVPQATAIHEEGQTTRLFPERLAIMQRSNALFAEKNKDYLDWNSNRVPLGNFNFLKA